MFSSDRHGLVTRRFGGVEFVPSSIQVRSFGEKGSHAAPVNENEARYNDFVPLIYGTAWFSPSIVFARNDGNLTRMEVLLGVGEIQAVLKVLVNDIEVPVGQAGVDMTGTGWFNVMSLGNRTGNFNTDFLDSSGQAAGGPYGGMAYMSVVVPNRINDGRALPTIKVLIQGMRISQFTTDGAFVGESFTNNPVWVLLDILRRVGWRVEEIDIPTFATAAQFCEEPIPMRDLHENPVLAPRFQCNLVVKSRRSAGDLVRGIRNASRLYLTYGTDGLLQVGVENAISLSSPQNRRGAIASLRWEAVGPAMNLEMARAADFQAFCDERMENRVSGFGHAALRIAQTASRSSSRIHSTSISRIAFRSWMQKIFRLPDRR